MKFSAIIVALTAAPMAMGCAVYFDCRCDNADGNPNEIASRYVCSQSYGGMATYDAGRQKCVAIGANAFNNCNFREDCAAQGATGDSNCGHKVL